MSRVHRLFLSSALGLLVLTILYILIVVLSDTGRFQDPALEAAVQEALELEGRHVSRSDLQRVTELDASGRGIEHIEGIRSMPNLVSLDLSGNRVTDLSPLGKLSSLNSLDLSNNNILDLEEVNLDALSDLPELRELNLANNRGPSHPESPGEHRRISDISVLSAFTELELLDLSYNHIEDLQALSPLTRLRRLDLRENLLTGNALKPLEGLARLEYLNLRHNQLRRIDSLSEFSLLRYLNLHSNENIESILPLAGLTSLETLILRRVPVGDEIQVLAELTNLRRLNIRETGVRNLEVLASLMKQGALQDDPQNNVFAEVDIRENPVSETQDGGGYEVLHEYWENIAQPRPQELPEPQELSE
ncbi:MAG: leucine-rich repeat domain-containing protein [Spirochaetia bacterium]